MSKSPSKHSRKPATEPRYWIGVVSLSHVRRGGAGGFAQLCHGKAAPLRRMGVGDWLIYYSPKTDMADGQPLQMFTAIGKVIGDRVYEHALAPDFILFRRDIAYQKCKPTAIQPLLAKLSFIQDLKHWGYPFRAGHIEITERDCRLIARAMGVRIDD